jgi:hypothetical protein
MCPAQPGGLRPSSLETTDSGALLLAAGRPFQQACNPGTVSSRFMKQCPAVRWVPTNEFLPLFLLLLLGGGSIHAQFSLDREPPGPSSRTTGLVITEIMYNPRLVPGLSTNLTHEFVEVFNSKPWDENLGGSPSKGRCATSSPRTRSCARGLIWWWRGCRT